jgi:hypothetical protein
MGNLERRLGELIGTFPALSPKAKETTVKVLPWVLIVLGVLGFLAWLSSLRFLFGFMGAVGRMPGYMGPDFLTYIHLALAPFVQVLVVYGGYLMLSRKARGWRFAFYALIFGVVAHVLAISIFGLILDCLFAYFLFQIREFYTVAG